MVGFVISRTPDQYLKEVLRSDTTGKKMIVWDDDYIDQSLSYEDACKIVKLMDNIFKKIMIEEGFHSRTIHNDRGIGTEVYENDNYEELIDVISNTWDRAYRIAYESVTKTELPDSIHIQEFVPRNMQPERMINPVIKHMIEDSLSMCTIEGA